MKTLRILASCRIARGAWAARTAWALAALALAAVWAAPARAQSVDAPVGRIEGDDISVRGEVQVVNENGRSYTSLASGSQVTVRSGRARIELAAGGGEIGICGPARFSLVRAGASLTLALDYGRVRARVADRTSLRIYTPQIAASPIAAAGGRADEVSVGLEENGKMCVHAASGALRLEPQFGGDNIVVPQGQEATLQDGQLSSLAGTGQACSCDALAAKRTAPEQSPNAAARIQLGAGSPPATEPAPETAEKTKPQPPPSAPGEQPIWKVAVPMTYSAGDEKAAGPAKGANMPPPTAQTAILFREVYVEPVIVWRGEVETPAPANAKASSAAANPAAQPDKKPSFGARMAGFFRRLFGGKPKQQPQSAANESSPRSSERYMPS